MLFFLYRLPKWFLQVAMTQTSGYCTIFHIHPLDKGSHGTCEKLCEFSAVSLTFHFAQCKHKNVIQNSWGYKLWNVRKAAKKDEPKLALAHTQTHTQSTHTNASTWGNKCWRMVKRCQSFGDCLPCCELRRDGGPKKVAHSLPSAKRANYFLPLSNHIFFRYCLLHFLFIRLDAQLAGQGGGKERRLLMLMGSGLKTHMSVCHAVRLSCRFGLSFNLIYSECSKCFRWVLFFFA